MPIILALSACFALCNLHPDECVERSVGQGSVGQDKISCRSDKTI